MHVDNFCWQGSTLPPWIWIIYLASLKRYRTLTTNFKFTWFRLQCITRLKETTGLSHVLCLVSFHGAHAKDAPYHHRVIRPSPPQTPSCTPGRTCLPDHTHLPVRRYTPVLGGHVPMRHHATVPCATFAEPKELYQDIITGIHLWTCRCKCKDASCSSDAA